MPSVATSKRSVMMRESDKNSPAVEPYRMQIRRTNRCSGMEYHPLTFNVMSAREPNVCLAMELSPGQKKGDILDILLRPLFSSPFLVRPSRPHHPGVSQNDLTSRNRPVQRQDFLLRVIRHTCSRSWLENRPKCSAGLQTTKNSINSPSRHEGRLTAGSRLECEDGAANLRRLQTIVLDRNPISRWRPVQPHSAVVSEV